MVCYVCVCGVCLLSGKNKSFSFILDLGRISCSDGVPLSSVQSIPLPFFFDIISLSYLRWFISLTIYVVYGVQLVMVFLFLLTEMNSALCSG
jgi:hypothetical protein